ncbi:ankyrin-1 isoform X2 [Octopus sinensis]|nr:ankyrin-1 isoform X2 [Octopus sinensis]
MSVMSSYWKQLQLKQIMDNVMNNVLSINQFWSWSILAIIIVTMILRNKRSKAKKSFYTELTKKKDDFKNPYKLNIYDLCKTAYRPGHTEAVIDLIERLHYDINAPLPSNGLTLFSCACLSGSKKLILYLLLKGADLMSVTKDGDGPLYLATYAALNSPETDVTTLDLLITYGCDVNRQNNKGYTPLHRAASKGNYKVVKCLLRHGARINVPNKSGIYPIDCASNAGHPEIAKILAFKVNNPHVWDVVEPHTPPSIKMGLRTPMRPNILQSPTYKRSFISQRMKPM